MSAPFSVHIVDAALADKARDQITLGGRFVFIDDAALLDSGRRGRLQSWRTQARKVVKAVVDGPLTVSGLRLTSTAPVAPRACALVADRDLYRTETDTARIVAVLPRLEPAERARLDVTLDGQALTSRAISAADGGLVVEPFGALVAGAYQASLLIDDVVVAGPVDFTVADYTLAPLSVRLRSRHIEGDQLVLGLTVETWQVPCVEQLRLSLVEGKRVHEVKLVHSEVPGRYDVAFTLRGEGALRVRAVVEADPSRSAECSIPGSRRSEREQIVVSELGREVLLSMLPTPRSLPVRGLHLEQGDIISTPIVVDDVVTATPSLRTIEAVEALTLAWWLPLSGTWHVEDIGDIAAGQRIALQAREPLALCFVGCFVDGGPFEAMTTFMRPDDDGELLVSHPAEVRPRGLLPVTIKTVGTRRVLLAIKDERLTSTDTPQVALQAKLKDGVTTLASVLGDDFAFTRVSALSAERGRAGLKVLISKTGTSPREERFFLNEVTIGSTRSIGNDIVLDGGTVSKRHARVVMRDDKLIVVDLQSTNGTFINGKRISAPQVLRDGDRLIIGDYWLRFELTGGVAAPAPSWDAPDEDFDSRTLVTARAEEMAVRRRAPAGLLGRSDDLDDLDDLDDADDADDADDDLRPRLLASASASAPASRREPPADRARAYAPAPKSPRMEPTGGAPQALSAPGSTTPPRDEVPVDDERPRETFPEILFVGVIEVDGEVTVEVPVGESLAAFQVLAFTLVDGAPAQRESRVQVDQPARADLDLPLEIADGDVANAVLRVSTRSGRAVVSLTRDGVAVAMFNDGVGLGDGASHEVGSGARLTFPVVAGRYRAQVQDVQTGERDTVDVSVGTPGVFARLSREIVFLSAGKSLTLDSAQALTMRVLPGLDQPMLQLCRATVDYDHACCEQTASKIVAAAAMFVMAGSVVDKDAAARAIVAGVERERRMWVRGRGFRMYPELAGISDYYTPTTVEHLWRLRRLADVRDLPASARSAVLQALEMADDVGAALRMRFVPESIKNAHDAWAVAARDPSRIKESLEWVGKAIAVDDNGPRSKLNGAIRGSVGLRSLFAYSSAVAMIAKKPTVALRLAQEVLKSLDEHGRLYSTLDSVAAIAMMGELSRAGVIGGTGRADINGTVMTARQGSELGDNVESIKVEDGVVVVELVRLKEERLTDQRSTVAVQVGLRGDGDTTAVIQRGRSVELVVALKDGYREGDLVQVSLPPCLVWLHGGGLVKRFTVDFGGRDRVSIPLAVVADPPGRQSLFVAVRNMFEEERVGVPGPVPVEPPRATPTPSPVEPTPRRSAGVLERLLGKRSAG